ncbi:MAG: hypothetical protein QNJ45_02535 [Ardenticatenaceae bacterium]|nr:hypothetical protein [Ardenticatenaceae bacterium]
MNVWKIFRRSIFLWWYEWPSLLLLGYGWALAQLLIVTGPPATAVLFVMCSRSTAGTYWHIGDAWREFKSLFWAGWVWGGINLLVIGIILVNLLYFASASGGIWLVLRLVWLLSLFVWLGLNGLYWPFWLAQENQSWRQTMQNCGRFWLLHPLTALSLTLIVLVIGVASVLTMLPLLLGSIPLLALLWLVAVEKSLNLQS